MPGIHKPTYLGHWGKYDLCALLQEYSSTTLFLPGAFYFNMYRTKLCISLFNPSILITSDRTLLLGLPPKQNGRLIECATH